MSTKLNLALASGELAALAKESRSEADIARRLGIHPDTYGKWKRARAAMQMPVPSFLELRDAQNGEVGTQIGDAKANGAEREVKPLDDFDAEEDTLPGVAAFTDAPDGFHVRGVSTLYDRDGEIAAQWVKTGRTPDDPIKAVTEAFQALRDELPRATELPTAPAVTNDDLLSVYLVGDGHVGLHAWHEDAGENYDLEIAERNLNGLTDRLVSLAPASSKALLVNIGDYTHSDNRANTTTRGTPVDVDGRWIKVVRASIGTRVHHIKRALEKHAEVYTIDEIGNHDTHVSLFQALALALYFENEPRVHVDVSPQLFHWFRFGKNLIGTHHGHTVKPQDLLGVMVSDRAQDWGETLYRYFYTGHIHHERVREFPGMLWESLRSPAPSDAWHRGQGYRSGHDIKLDVLHHEYGRIQRHTVGIPRMLGEMVA